MDWTDADEQDWQSLLASEPVSGKKTLNQNGEYQPMLQLQEQKKANTSNVPAGVQFLSPRHVTTPEGFKLKVTEVTTDEPDTFGNPVVVYFEDKGGVKYSKGFTLASEGLHQISKLLTTDETKWAGKIITCSKRVNKRGGEQLVFSK